ncbi:MULTISPECIES: amidohydrolase family protein [Bacillus]|uniref:amidohydrolase family protein n=1 Tax=Bacillus TaxID=1386 RepID=UPI001481DC3B|nr:amidohydrolase family protein [Bacillus pseudomycoides]
MYSNLEPDTKYDRIVLSNAVYYSEKHSFCEADIVISRNRIEKILPPNSLKSDDCIDAQNLVIFPGLINAHLHPSKEIYGGMEAFCSISDVLDKVHKNNHLETPKLQSLASLYSILNSIRQGVTTIGMFTSRAEVDAEQAKEAGVRAVVHFSQNDHWIGKESNPEESSLEKILQRYIDCSEKYESELIQIHPATASELTATPELMQELHKIAKEQNKKFVMHICEGNSQVEQCLDHYGETGIELLNRLGLLDSSTLLVHAAKLSERDIEILLERQLNFIHCPVSNSFTGAGRFPFKKLLHNNIGLGTDAAMVNLFNSMSYEAAFALYFHGESSLEEKVRVTNIIDSLTKESALALGIEDLGTIEEGMLADLCFFDRKSIFIDSQEPPLLFLNTILKKEPVHVMINGKFNMFNRNISKHDFSQIEKEFIMNKRLER